MQTFDDIEIGIQYRHYNGIRAIKKFFYVTGAWLVPSAGAFVSELVIFNALHKTSDLFDDDGDLPVPLYMVAACTSSLVGYLLGPRIYRILRHDP